MADYTPATPQVRAAYVRAMRNAFIASAAEHEAEFDRWLAARDARVKAEAARNALLAAAELEFKMGQLSEGLRLQSLAKLYDTPARAAEYRADEERNHG